MLFLKINGKIATGSISNTYVSANSYEDVEISFGKTFASIPKVFLTLSGSGDNAYRGNVSAFVVSGTTSKANIRIYNASAATLTIGGNWLAVL